MWRRHHDEADTRVREISYARLVLRQFKQEAREARLSITELGSADESSRPERKKSSWEAGETWEKAGEAATGQHRRI